MENKFIFDIYSIAKKGFEEVEIEIQAMDNFIFDDTMTQYSKDIDFKKTASKLLTEMIVKPTAAQKVEFFKDDYEGLEEVFKTLTDFQTSFKKKPGKRKGRRPASAS